MGLFDRFRGTGVQRPVAPQPPGAPADDQAIARYRYLLRTAPPETIERAHAEAFAQLTPEQRRRVLDELAHEVPDAERSAVLRAGDGPGELARAATRAELRRPGAIERVLGGFGTAPGLGGLFAGSLLASMAGTVLGSMIAQTFFASHADAHPFGDAPHDADAATHAAADRAGDDALSSGGFDDAGGGDFGSGFDGGDTFDV